MEPTNIFSVASILFTLYWHDESLRRDYRILTTCGHVQREAAKGNRDTPSGWFFEAARSYVGNDQLGILARRTCVVVGMALEDGVPS